MDGKRGEARGPLSPMLFNLVLADLEEEMGRGDIGRRRSFHTLING